MTHLRTPAVFFSLAAMVWAASIGSATAQRVVKDEPPLGELKSGQFVYVDNGKCPKGQILKVTAGIQTGGGRANSNMKGSTREKVCVPRPS